MCAVLVCVCLNECCITSSPQAIRDGVIDASINHDGGFLQSKVCTQPTNTCPRECAPTGPGITTYCQDVADVYATTEPQEAFHQRASFCLKLHNDSVKVHTDVSLCFDIIESVCSTLCSWLRDLYR